MSQLYYTDVEISLDSKGARWKESGCLDDFMDQSCHTSPGPPASLLLDEEEINVYIIYAFKVFYHV